MESHIAFLKGRRAGNRGMVDHQPHGEGLSKGIKLRHAVALYGSSVLDSCALVLPGVAAQLAGLVRFLHGYCFPLQAIHSRSPSLHYLLESQSLEESIRSQRKLLDCVLLLWRDGYSPSGWLQALLLSHSLRPWSILNFQIDTQRSREMRVSVFCGEEIRIDEKQTSKQLIKAEWAPFAKFASKLLHFLLESNTFVY